MYIFVICGVEAWNGEGLKQSRNKEQLKKQYKK